MSVSRAASEWVSDNTAVAALRYRNVPVRRLRYEDLVGDPAGVLRRAWTDLGLPGQGQLPMVDATTLDLQPSHGLGGSALRFERGATTLRGDAAGRSEMDPRDRRLVTAMSLPHLVAYGYVGRKSS